MKDLYPKLGIDDQASATEVAVALELKPEMRIYAPILLDEQKRAEYDKAHATLRAIGTLRHRLGLNSGDSWFLENCPDFMPKLRSTVPSAKSGQVKSEESRPEESRPEESRPEESDKVPQHKSVKSRPSARSKWLVPVLLGIIVVMLLVLIFTFF